MKKKKEIKKKVFFELVSNCQHGILNDIRAIDDPLVGLPPSGKILAFVPDDIICGLYNHKEVLFTHCVSKHVIYHMVQGGSLFLEIKAGAIALSVLLA